MRLWPGLFVAFACSGCAAALTVDGTFQVSPGTAPGSDYRVALVNRSDVNFDGDKLEDRKRVTTDLLKSPACPNPTMIDETAMRWGTWGLGTPRVTYYSDWKCK